MTRTGVMQVVDTLAIGGLERVAVNLSNCLPAEQFRSYLCATRSRGPLMDSIRPGVEQVYLDRQGRFDFLRSGRRLAKFINDHGIEIVHAHGTSVFVCAVASLFAPKFRLLWHDHFGRVDTEDRPLWLYGLAARRVQGVIAVNEKLAAWSREKLGLSADRVWYVPNFVCEPKNEALSTFLPGRGGFRIVCVANLRPQKDHLTLLGAMKLVSRKVPEAHLLLLGAANDPVQKCLVEKAILTENLNVSWLGECTNVMPILKECDVGVLSSISEGLPLALIEYGMAGLSSVATDVGQCSEVLDRGQCGLLVPAKNPVMMASSIITLLKSPARRTVLGEQFKKRVRETYSETAIIKRICEIYKTLL